LEVRVLALALAFALSAAPPAPAPVCPSAQATPDVQQLVAFTEQVMSGKSLSVTMTMRITTPAYTRTLKLAIQSEGDDYALIKVLEGGAREVGMMTLKREKQLWNYLPQAGRVMKLPSGMLGDAWMGSDFTNDDLVRGTSMSKDFTATVVPVGGDAWTLTLVPKESAVVVWGKIEMLVDRKTCLPREQRFFDEEMKLARTMTFANPKQFGWRTFPTKMTVKPADGAKKETSVEYADLVFDQDIPDETFSLHRLQQGR
jgi:outer membrane lipoprotein-sorting protein